MNFKLYFLGWSKEVDSFLASYFARRAREVKKATPLAADLITDFADFISGGKRLRAGLVRLGYEVFGGKDPEKVLPIAAATEVLHGAYLVHDDIIDSDLVRHNKPTIHARYEARLRHKMSQEKIKGNKALHYGESIGIMVGDIAFFEAIKLVFSSNLASGTKEKIAKELLDVAITTGFGEALDIDLPHRDIFTEQDVLTIHNLKTAYYTYFGPLMYGAFAAGAPIQKILAVKEYALPLGLAFQLQDDILGMFGDEKTIGKSADSDIKQGKNTLLYVEALKIAPSRDRAFLRRVWGNPQITVKELGEARRIIKDSGSMDYSVQMARDLVESAKRAIPRLTTNKELQNVLETLADYTVGREK